MGTGSVEDWCCSGDFCCQRCLSPFSGGDTEAPWKKGTGTKPSESLAGFASVVAWSQSPFSTPRLPFGTYRINIPPVTSTVAPVM